MTTTGRVSLTAAPDGADLLLSAHVGEDGGGRTLPACTLAVADALRVAARVPADVLWPASVTLPQPRCGGAGSSRQVADVVLDGGVVTVRLSLSASAQDLPAGWTSVRAEGGTPDAEGIAAALARTLAERLRQAATGDPALTADYRERCRTFGRLVDVDGRQGWVSDLAADGGLLATVGGEQVRVPPGALAVPA